MALWGRRINNFLELWYLVASRGLGIWVSSTSFQKSNIGWPQQPLTKKVFNFNMIFHDSTQKCFFQNAPRHHNLQKCWSFYPSEPFRILHFNMRHPVDSYRQDAFFTWVKRTLLVVHFLIKLPEQSTLLFQPDWHRHVPFVQSPLLLQS